MKGGAAVPITWCSDELWQIGRYERKFGCGPLCEVRAWKLSMAHQWIQRQI